MRLRLEIVLALTTGVASCVLGWWVLGISLGDVGKPWANGDALGVYSVAKTIAESGWYTPTHRLGFPSVQDLYLLPSGDLRYLFEIKIVTMFTKNPFTAVNVMSLFGFFLIGSAAYWLLRLLRVSVWIVFPMAISLSLLPWHFTRLSGHLYLADYSSVVVGLVALTLLLGWLRASGSIGGRSLLLRCIGIALLALYVGGSGLYYTFITIVLVVVILVRPVIAQWSLRSAIPTISFGVVALGTLFGWLAAQKVLSISVVDPIIYSRQYLESEMYGGSITTLFLPGTGSGIRALATWRTEFDALTLFHSEGKADNSLVGIVAVIVSFVLIGLTLAPLGIRSRGNALCQFMSEWCGGVRQTLTDAAAEIREMGLALGFLVALLFFATGGFGALFAFFVNYQIRGWGRFSVVVIIIAICILSVVLSRLGQSWRDRTMLILIGATLLVVVGVEQVGGSYAMPVAAMSATQQDAQGLMTQVEATSATGCGVLSLPVIEFPESPPVNGMLDYDELWPYVSSSNLRFSYGVIKKTSQSGFQGQFLGEFSSANIALLRDSGICGILVDTFGYPDRGEGLVASLVALTHHTPATSPAGRWVYIPIVDR